MNPFVLELMLQAAIHVPGLRGNPGRTYQVTGAGPQYPATFEHYVASVISRWQSQDHETYHSLNYDLERVGLAKRVEVELLRSSLLRVLHCGITAEDGLVTISGHVQSEEEIEEAIRLAETVEGVSDVESELDVINFKPAKD